MKTCSRCLQAKEEKDFRKQASTKDGLKYLCRLCDNLTQREFYHKNKKYHKARTKVWRQAHRDKSREYSRKYRARKKNSQKTVIRQDSIQPV
jgi:hypothetical protein